MIAKSALASSSIELCWLRRLYRAEAKGDVVPEYACDHATNTSCDVIEAEKLNADM